VRNVKRIILTAPKGIDQFLSSHDHSYPFSLPRYVFSFSASDYTGNTWLNAFNETGVRILGMTADDLANQRNTPAYTEAFSNACYKQYRFGIRAKNENYNGDPKVRYNVVNVEPIDFVSETTNLIQQIRQLAM
jgi:replication factor A1